MDLLVKTINRDDPELGWMYGNRGDPATLAIITTVAVAGSAVMGAVGSIAQGQAQGRADDYNAAIQKNNALTATRVAASREEAQRRQANLELGDQTAAIAQAGIGFGGSAADIARQSRINESLKALDIRYAGATQSQAYQSQANLLQYQAGQDRTAGYLGAGTAILGGISDYGLSPEGQRQLRNLRTP